MAVKRVKKRRLKKKLVVVIFIIALALIGGGTYFLLFNNKQVKETTVVSKIPKYGYTLKSNKSKKYKELFQELKKVLSKENVNEKEYAKVITKMFIVDFYSLGDHVAKTDVGGVDFLSSIMLDNFLENAEDTYYKYVESNIYGSRKQKLPIVDKITIKSAKKKEFTYNKTINISEDEESEEDVETETDPNAYEVKASWTYKNKNIASGYQTEATLIYVHDGKKLVLVELSNGEETEDE